MGGHAPPDSSWKGSLNVSYNVGPGFTTSYSTRSVLCHKESILGTRGKQSSLTQGRIVGVICIVPLNMTISWVEMCTVENFSRFTF